MTARLLIAILTFAFFCGRASAEEIPRGDAAGPSALGQDYRQADAIDADQGILDHFRGTRRTTLRIFKRGEQTPVFTLSADVGEIDDTNSLTVTLDNDAPPPRGKIWMGTEGLPPPKALEGPALPALVPADDPDQAWRNPRQLALAPASTWSPPVWSQDGSLRIVTDAADGFPAIAVSSPRITALSAPDELPTDAPAVPDPPAFALWVAGLAVVSLSLNRRRPRPVNQT
jgi:hypothetical protein